MSLETWILFCGAVTVLCIMPGPAVLCVVSAALARGPRHGFSASLGILAANTAYFALSAAGLGAVLLASRKVFVAIKWIGALYIIYIGVRMLFARRSPPTTIDPPTAPAARKAFWNACLIQIANPNAIVFFTAFIPQFINPDGPIALQIFILAATTVVVELVVLSVYVAACFSARQWMRSGRFGGVLQRVGGGLLILAGARLAAMRGG